MAHSLFVSDLHLDGCRPEQLGAFVAFLRGPARRAQALYILGDLFDVWVGDDAMTGEWAPVLDGLRALSDAGVAVSALHGNRDFLLGEAFARRTGVRLLPPRGVVDVHGTPTLIEHGDLLCIDDAAYQRYRRLLRHPATLALLRSIPKGGRARLARRLRAASARALAAKSMQIMDVNPAEVRRVMRAAGVRRLIHGHTHRPAVHRFALDGACAVRAVLGDWYERRSWLVADADGVSAVSA